MDLDLSSLQILGTVHPELKARMCRVYQDVFTILRLEMRPTRGLASLEDQRKIWMIGRDADGNVVDDAAVVTNAAAGSSWHNFGCAIDSCFRGMDPYWAEIQKTNAAEASRRWSEFGRIAVSHGLEWGGNFPHYDGPHVQLRFGMNLKEAQTLFKLGGLQSIFAKANQIVKGD